MHNYDARRGGKFVVKDAKLTTYDTKRAKKERWNSVMLTPWSSLNLCNLEAEGL